MLISVTLWVLPLFFFFSLGPYKSLAFLLLGRRRRRRSSSSSSSDINIIIKSSFRPTTIVLTQFNDERLHMKRQDVVRRGMPYLS